MGLYASPIFQALPRLQLRCQGDYILGPNPSLGVRGETNSLTLEPKLALGDPSHRFLSDSQGLGVFFLWPCNSAVGTERHRLALRGTICI